MSEDEQGYWGELDLGVGETRDLKQLNPRDKNNKLTISRIYEENKL